MKSEKSNHIDMNKRDLKKLSKSELIKLLLKQHKPKIIVVDDTKPVPTPRIYIQASTSTKETSSNTTQIGKRYDSTV